MAPLVIAPPTLQPATGGTAVLVETAYQAAADPLVEEPMDYTPLTGGQAAAPAHPRERWPEGSGPMGF